MVPARIVFLLPLQRELAFGYGTGTILHNCRFFLASIPNNIRREFSLLDEFSANDGTLNIS
jgi:hypothetical protein